MSFSNDIFSSRFATTEGGPPANVLQEFIIQEVTRVLVSDTLLFSDLESKVEIPYSVALGWAQNWSDNFLTSLDVEYQPFAKSKFLILESTMITPTGRKITEFREEATEWKNTIQLRAGAEYTIKSRFGNIPLRTGFGILPQPYRDVREYAVFYNGIPDIPLIPFEDNSVPGLLGVADAYYGHRDIDILYDNTGDQVVAYSFSLGAGLHSAQRALDFAYVYTTATRSYNTSFATELPEGYDAFDVPLENLLIIKQRSSEVKNRDHKFIISFTGYF